MNHYESMCSTTLAKHSFPQLAGLNLQTRGARATKKYIRNPWENGACGSERISDFPGIDGKSCQMPGIFGLVMPQILGVCHLWFSSRLMVFGEPRISCQKISRISDLHPASGSSLALRDQHMLAFGNVV